MSLTIISAYCIELIIILWSAEYLILALRTFELILIRDLFFFNNVKGLKTKEK